MPSIATKTKTKTHETTKKVKQNQDLDNKKSKSIQKGKIIENDRPIKNDKPVKNTKPIKNNKPKKSKTISNNIVDDENIKIDEVSIKKKTKKEQYKKGTSIDPNTDSATKSKKKVIIDIYNNDSCNRQVYQQEIINEYTACKVNKEDSRNYLTIELYDEKSTYTDKIENNNTDIECDFHSRALDISKIIAIDMDFKAKRPSASKVKPQEPIDIDSMKKAVIDKSETITSDVEDFFNKPVIEEYIPLDRIKTVDINNAIKNDNNSTDIYADLLKDFEETTTAYEDDSKLTFGGDSADTYIDDEPIIMGNDFAEQVNLNANINTLDNLQFEIEED